MAEDPRTYQSSTPQANRNLVQGGGSGQKDMDLQQSPNREQHATDPQNSEGWDNDAASQTGDRPSEADFSGQDVGEQRSFQDADDGDEGVDRTAAGVGQVGDLGSGTPANVDIHNLGQDDNPQAEWGESAGEGAVFSSNHTKRAERTEADRGQGPKTRQLNKDINSGRN